MSYTNEKTVTISWGGLGMFLLFLLFLGLKLGGVIAWSWWWVTAPLWGPFVLSMAICAVIFVVWAIVKLFKALFSKNLFGK